MHIKKSAVSASVAFLTLISLSASVSAATITKAPGTTATLDTGAAWDGGVVPGANDIAYFDSTSVPTGSNPISFTTNASLTIGELELFIQPTTADTQANINANGNLTLTLEGVNGIGIDNASFQPPPSGNKNANLQLGSTLTVNVANSQTWEAVNRGLSVLGSITGASNVTLTKTGLGGVQLGNNAAVVNTFAGSLVLAGQGITTLDSSWTNLSNLNVQGGTVNINLNQTTVPAAGTVPGGGLINNTATLTLSGGNLTISGLASASQTQSFASTTVGGGGSNITLATAAGNSTTLNLGTLTRSTGGFIDFLTPTGTGTGTVNVTGGSSGMLKTSNGIAYAIVGTGATANWAALDGSGNVVAFTGSTTVSGSALGSANNGEDVLLTSTGTVNVTSANLSTLQLADEATARNVVIGSGQVLTTGGILSNSSTTATTISGPGTITALAGTQELTVITTGSQQLSFNAAITDNAGGAVSVTYGGTGIVNIGNGGTYTGETFVDDGTARMNGNTAGNANSTYDVGSNATLNVNNNVVTIGGLTGNGATTLGDGTLNVGGNNASTTYNGDFTGAPGTANAPAGQTLTPAIVKNGTGTLRLNGNSALNSTNYTGSVTVNGGALLVNGSLANATGVTVNNGATLGGTGTVSGITANAGAIIAPGDGVIGTFSASSLTLNGSAQFNFALSSVDTTSDLLSLSGALTDASGAADTFDFSLTGGTVGDTYTLMDFGSTNLTDTSKFAIDSAGYTGNFSIVNGDEIQVTLTSAAPEPSTWAMLLCGGGMMIFIARRKLC